MTYGIHPTITVDPAIRHPRIVLTATIFAAHDIREAADRANCSCEESWGIFNRDYTIRGSAAELQEFVRLAWNNDGPFGQSSRNLLRKIARE